MDEIERILRHTLSDFRVSRGEKRVLKKLVDEMGLDRRQLAGLRHKAFEIARSEIVSPDAAGVLDWLEDIAKILQDDPDEKAIKSEAYFSPGNKCGERIASLFVTARRTVDVCVFTITDDRVSDAILDAHKRGVSIRIVTDNDKAEDIGSDVGRLSRQGIPVRADRSDHHMHHKFAIFDEQRVLTGSYNWTRSAAKYNEENFIVSDNEDLLREFTTAFERLWERLK
jgi:cardiolipin hydrolase